MFLTGKFRAVYECGNLAKTVQKEGTMGNARYLLDNGHNGIYAIYDKAKITSEDIPYIKTIDMVYKVKDDPIGIGDDCLHGMCNEVASIIHNFDNNWKVMNLYNGRPVHTFCEYTSPEGEVFYADARGVTKNWQEFVAEYAGELKTTDLQELKESADYRSGLDSCFRESMFYDEAQKFVNSMSHVFRTDVINEMSNLKDMDMGMER